MWTTNSRFENSYKSSHQVDNLPSMFWPGIPVLHGIEHGQWWRHWNIQFPHFPENKKLVDNLW